MAELSIGDMLFQLVALTVPVLTIVLIGLVVRSLYKRKNQLDAIEENLDEINNQIMEEKN
ncbi:DUF4083 domain-containing protein [Bacillus carboniphilus]|uniref:DUF4083 domain-containing protein n=1 Tax=Bacillus carboniphilus TaxID=86663 RepID=A0ABY9JT50_9BACI|nr:DUF4083 domain-containing protein [Bacillus carboniphilus]WLR42559.1 DUF4083 domain-containing protein [Bacillus carboniphilus]